MAGPIPRIPVRGALLGRQPIPDVLQAVDSPQRLSDDPAALCSCPSGRVRCPAHLGRDELGAGDVELELAGRMAARGSGHDMSAITPPAHGRAPGWAAGMPLARREQ